MNVVKTVRSSFLGLSGIIPSRRRGQVRPRRPLLLNLERIEDRVVPAFLDPGIAASINAVSLVKQSNPVPVDTDFLHTDPSSFPGVLLDKFSQDNGEICATFTLNTSDPNVVSKLQGTDGLQVSLDSYVIKNAQFPGNQTLVRSVTATLTLQNPTVKLCVEGDDYLCFQVDARYGKPIPNVVDSGPQLLGGAVFHPDFDDNGIETFTLELTDQGGHDAQSHQMKDCNSAVIGPYGLTIGFWKNHYANWNYYTPDTRLGDIFAGLDVPAYSGLADLTFAQALSLGGGPGLSDKAGLLVKQAVGGLLNATNPQVGYPLTTSEIKVAVDNALASMNATTINNLQGQFESLNSVDKTFLPLTDPTNNHQKK